MELIFYFNIYEDICSFGIVHKNYMNQIIEKKFTKVGRITRNINEYFDELEIRDYSDGIILRLRLIPNIRAIIYF